ncbi:MAG: WD40 repeat domain-containing serine/threonine protein kinase, partial [Limisphaerales bacterium]
MASYVVTVVHKVSAEAPSSTDLPFGRYVIAGDDYAVGLEATKEIPIHARVTFKESSVELVKLATEVGMAVNDQSCSTAVTSPYPVRIRIADTEIHVRLGKMNDRLENPEESVATVLAERAEEEAPSLAKTDRVPVHSTIVSRSRSTGVNLPSSAVGSDAVSFEAGVAAVYRVGEELARGGMGAILRAIDGKFDRTVAMKVLLPESMTESARRRFVREARILARLEHPNIVPVYDIGDEDGDLSFYTMKLVRGVTLDKILKRIRDGDEASILEYPLDQLLVIFRKVCDALGFAHERGIVHRDLKPENIMVGAFGEVLVMDWGIAKLMEQDDVGIDSVNEPLAEFSDDALTMAGAVMGTPRFMAPEQAEGEQGSIDQRTDVYAMGAILYNILTLHPPVSGTKVSEILDRVKSGSITPPTCFDSAHEKAPSVGVPAGAISLRHLPSGRIPAGLSAVAMQALALEPSDRYLDVGELGADVGAYQAGFATAAEDLSVFGHLALFVGRHRAVAVTCFVAFVVIALVTTGFMIQLKHEEQAAIAEAGRARMAESAANDERKTAERQKTIAEEQKRAAQKAFASAATTLAARSCDGLDWRTALETLNRVDPEFRDSYWRHVRQRADNSIHFELPVDNVRPYIISHPTKPGVFGFLWSNRQFQLREFPSGRELLAFSTELDGNQFSLPSFDRAFGGRRAAISPDGETLGITDGVRIHFYDLASGRETRIVRTSSRHHTAFHFVPDTELVVWNSAQEIVAFSRQTGRRVWAIGGLLGSGIKHVIAVSPKLIYSFRKKIFVADARTGETERELASTGVAKQGTVSPDGSRLIYAGEGSGMETNRIVRAIDLANGREFWNLTPGLARGDHLQFSPDGKTFARGIKLPTDDSVYSIELRDASNGELIRHLSGGTNFVRHLSVHPLSGHIVGAGRNSKIWQPGILPSIAETSLRVPFAAAAFGHYGSNKALAPNWTFVDDQTVLLLEDRKAVMVKRGRGTTRGAVYLPTDYSLYTVTNGIRFSVTNLIPFGTAKQLRNVDLSRDNRWASIAWTGNRRSTTLARREGPGFVRVREIPTIPGPTNRPKYARHAPSPDGSQLLKASHAGAVVVNTLDFSQTIDLRNDPESYVQLYSASWLPDGSRLIT